MEVSAGQTVTSIREMSPFKRWLTTTCLVVFTMIVAAICIVLLASTLTQSRLAFSVDGAQITVRKIDFVAREWGRHRVDREQKGWAALAAELQSRKLRQELADAQRQFAPLFNRMERLLTEFNLKIQHSEPVLFDATNKKGHDVQVIRIGAEKDRLIKDHPELETLIEKIEKTYESYPSLQSVRDEARRKVEENTAILNDLMSSANAADTGVNKSFELIKPNLDPAERLRAESAFLELGIEDYLKSGDGSMNIFRRAIAVTWYMLLTTQPDLMTLFLVIFMGVLGSALQITQVYFIRNEAYSIGRYFQRISVGALTALVIFIVAKAGIPVIAEPSRLTGEASVNPYFVSFLAIISGLLSENAITHVQAQGTRLFGQAAGLARWARDGVLEEINTQNLSLEKLAKQLGLESAVLQTKLQGQQEMNANEQEVVALYLRREPRDLFTDLPPSR